MAGESIFKSGETGSRGILAQSVVVFSFIAITLLGLVAVWQTPGEAKPILTMLLPVFGTWIGTVLAYYFSKENFAIAADKTAALVKQLTPDEKLKSLLAGDVMLPIGNVDRFELKDPKSDPKDVVLKTDLLEALLEPKNRNRLPILDAGGIVRHLLHRSTIDRFLLQTAFTDGADARTATLADLLADPATKQLLEETFGTIKATDTLADAKTSLDKFPNRSDIIVTTDGTAASPAVGWITNVMIADKSKV